VFETMCRLGAPRGSICVGDVMVDWTAYGKLILEDMRRQ
jgi:hypothetical protein